MTFFRIDPTSPFFIRTIAGQMTAAVVEYSNRSSVRRSPIVQMNGVWRTFRGAMPSGLLFSASTIMPEGFEPWIAKQAVTPLRSFALPDEWTEVNTHLLKTGALDG